MCVCVVVIMCCLSVTVCMFPRYCGQEGKCKMMQETEHTPLQRGREGEKDGEVGKEKRNQLPKAETGIICVRLCEREREIEREIEREREGGRER